MNICVCFCMWKCVGETYIRWLCCCRCFHLDISCFCIYEWKSLLFGDIFVIWSIFTSRREVKSKCLHMLVYFMHSVRMMHVPIPKCVVFSLLLLFCFRYCEFWVLTSILMYLSCEMWVYVNKRELPLPPSTILVGHSLSAMAILVQIGTFRYFYLEFFLSKKRARMKKKIFFFQRMSASKKRSSKLFEGHFRSVCDPRKGNKDPRPPSPLWNCWACRCMYLYNIHSINMKIRIAISIHGTFWLLLHKKLSTWYLRLIYVWNVKHIYKYLEWW